VYGIDAEKWQYMHRIAMPRLILILAIALPLSVFADDRYEVHFDEGLKTVTVDACFDGAAPRRLYRSSDAGKFTQWIRSGDRDMGSGSRSGTLKLPGLPEDACIRWRVDLDKAVAQSDYRLAMRVGHSILTSGNLWFWRDDEARPITVEVRVPTGMSVSAPWQELEARGDSLLFQPDSTPASWSSRIAVGPFPVQRIRAGGAELRVAAIGDLNRRQLRKFGEWMRETGEAVASVYGRFPQQSPQFLIVPIGPRETAVPWAHVIRGGGMAAEFFVDETLPLETYFSDWTATHELSHMLLPYVTSRDRWLSEGLASYYQNVLRARDGRLSEQEAWQKLHEGFGRGRAATKGGSLASATRSGWNSVMRVYWSGAAMMLKADTELRRESGGRQSLDTALASLQQCCLQNGRSWTAREIFGELDGITGTDIFSNLYRQHVQDDEFPDVSQTFERLGLVVESGEVKVDPDAPWSRIRYYIMNG
jgi:hypothetical protein